jgi:hypothetical protein
MLTDDANRHQTSPQNKRVPVAPQVVIPILRQNIIASAQVKLQHSGVTNTVKTLATKTCVQNTSTSFNWEHQTLLRSKIAAQRYSMRAGNHAVTAEIQADPSRASNLEHATRKFHDPWTSEQ